MSIMPKNLKNKEVFKKSERLYLRSQVQQLFEKGKSFKVFPFRVVFLIHSDNKNGKDAPLSPSIELLISVSKHRFKKAVDRNRIKRLIRESYRRHEGRHLLYKEINTPPLHLNFAIIVLTQSLPTFSEVDLAMGRVLCRLQKAVEKHNSKEGEAV